MSDMYSQLRALSWKGQELPCSEASFGLSKRVAQHDLTYHSGQLLQNLGANSERYSYTIPLHQTQLGRWKNCYTELFPELLANLQDETDGALIDPLKGETRAMVSEYGWKLMNSEGRSGINVHVSLVEASELGEDEEPELLTVAAAEAAAAQYDGNKIYHEQTEIKPEALSALKAPHRFATQAMATMDRKAAQLDALAGQMERTQEAFEKLGDVRNWRLIAAAKRLGRASKASARPPRPRKRIKSHWVHTETSLHQLAADLDTTTNDLQRLNGLSGLLVSGSRMVLHEVTA